MAKNYNDIYNSVYVTGNKMDWTNAMIRGNGIPLDIYSVFDTYNKAVEFAATNAVAYEGQILAVTENGDTTVYVITPAKQGTVTIGEKTFDVYLKEVGSKTDGDNKTIVLNDGVLSLKNFGVEYYKYYPAVEADIETGTEAKDAYYEKTQGWIDGLQPKVVNTGTTDEPVYEIAWFEPSSTTVEGLSEAITTLTDRIATAEGTITSQATSIENLEQNKANKATTLEGYGITDAYTKDEVNGLISGAFHFKGEVDYYSDLIAKTDALEGDVYIVKYAGTEGTVALNAEYAYNGETWVEFGSVIDLSGYATKTEVSEISKNIDAINNETTGILSQAKSYADGLNTAMDARVKANTDTITAISNEENGILAQAKSYTDDEVAKNKELIDSINNEETGILKKAKDYTDAEVAKNKELIDDNTEAITAINNEESGILSQAKGYADGLNTAMDTRVSANTTAIDAINNTETGILKQAKDDATTKDNALKTELTGAIDTAKTGAISDSKTYTDAEIEKINESVNTKVSQLETADTTNLAEAKAYTDEQVATVASTAANAMKYKGTVGTGGTIETLPTTGVTNGDTYKVIVDGTYDNQQAFVGDVFIAVVTTTDDTATISWTLIPAGDDGNVNTADTILTDGSLVIGKGNKEITTLANGSDGQILKIVDGKPSFGKEKEVIIASDDSINVETNTEENITTYTVSVKKVSTDLLVQGDQVLIFDGGNSVIETVQQEETV